MPSSLNPDSSGQTPEGESCIRRRAHLRCTGTMPDPVVQTRLEELQAQRRALQDRETALEKECAELEKKINALHKGVKANPETVEEASGG